MKKKQKTHACARTKTDGGRGGKKNQMMLREGERLHGRARSPSATKAVGGRERGREVGGRVGWKGRDRLREKKGRRDQLLSTWTHRFDNQSPLGWNWSVTPILHSWGGVGAGVCVCVVGGRGWVSGVGGTPFCLNSGRPSSSHWRLSADKELITLHLDRSDTLLCTLPAIKPIFSFSWLEHESSSWKLNPFASDAESKRTREEGAFHRQGLF